MTDNFRQRFDTLVSDGRAAAAPALARFDAAMADASEALSELEEMGFEPWVSYPTNRGAKPSAAVVKLEFWVKL